MKKRVFGRQLSRERDTRRALFRSLMRSMIFNGKMITTKAKALAVQGEIENIVTLAKSNTVAAKRRVYATTGNNRVLTDFIYKTVVPALSERKSGFTKLTNLPRRSGDRAKMVRLEWVLEIERKDSGKKETRKATVKKETEKPEGKENLTSKVKKVLKRGK